MAAAHSPPCNCAHCGAGILLAALVLDISGKFQNVRTRHNLLNTLQMLACIEI